MENCFYHYRITTHKSACAYKTESHRIRKETRLGLGEGPVEPSPCPHFWLFFSSENTYLALAPIGTSSRPYMCPTRVPPLLPPCPHVPRSCLYTCPIFAPTRALSLPPHTYSALTATFDRPLPPHVPRPCPHTCPNLADASALTFPAHVPRSSPTRA